MKNQTSFWVLCLLVATLFLLPQAASAQCKTSSFLGNFQFNMAGTGNGPLTVVFMTADGNGGFSDTETFYFPAVGFIPIPGVSVPGFNGETNHGTYQMNDDCTFSMTFHPTIDNCANKLQPCFFPINWDGVLVKGTTGFYAIATDQGVVAAGVGTKI